MDKILVYRSCYHEFDPSYGTSFFFFLVLFFDHTHTHICVFGVQRAKALFVFWSLVVMAYSMSDWMILWQP